ncbi:MAG: 2-C-methyl-D-erythritol 4-phosphate cytidylyltransferase [Planctomycetota bacterium]|jgi:2-C-methyl-D-erythritol 4-phosphate cytidylyltransferase
MSDWTGAPWKTDYPRMNGTPPQAAAVIVAAGSSTRMAAAGVTGRKPSLELNGVSILEHTLRAFNAAARVSEIIIVTHADDVDAIQQLAAINPAFEKVRAVVEGGEQRADSVRLGVFWCNFDVDVIAVHDAARPLIESETIDATIIRAAETGAALVALAVRDTIKRTAADETFVESTLDRSRLFAAQTPQAFRASTFRKLIERAKLEQFRPTDDSALWEHFEGSVAVVAGSPTNFKITTPEDLELAEALLANRREQKQS